MSSGSRSEHANAAFAEAREIWSRARSTRPGSGARAANSTGSRPRAFFEIGSAQWSAALTVDRAIIEELFALAPPGMDEIVGILTILDALVPGPQLAAETGGKQNDGRFDLVIVDSAPPGTRSASSRFRRKREPGCGNSWRWS